MFAYSLAILLAAFFIRHLYPLAFFLGHGGFFESGDAAQHVSGWLFYARDAWHFPLLHTERLNHPAGVSIVFTDSIPLAALPFKAIAPWLPEHFHYIGLWHAVALFLQAIAATLLIRVLGLRHALASVSAVIFALTWPALLWRFRHTALMSHGLILLALAFYFLGRQGKLRGNPAAVAFTLLSVAGLTIHPYFLAFCYPVFLAFLADQAMDNEGWLPQLPRLAASAIVICLTAAVLGYFGKNTVTDGFDHYSSNLASPFCGGRFIPCVADATGGQYEGYDYLGLGLLLLLPAALAWKWRKLGLLAQRYPALLLILTLFAVYALSTKVYAGSNLLFSYSLPATFDSLTGTFRVSGRFIWIVGYVILFACLFALLEQRSWRSVLLLAFALPLQWIDVQPLRQSIMLAASEPSRNNFAQWEKLIAQVDKIHVYPAFGCGGHAADTYLVFQELAAHYDKLIDTGYIARPNVDCASNARAFDSGFMERHLYVMPANHLNERPLGIPAGFAANLQLGQCVKWQASILCQSAMAQERWQHAGLPIEPIPALSPKAPALSVTLRK
jgi:hypothetical protein